MGTRLHNTDPLIQSILVILILIAFTLFLRKRKILTDSHKQLFSKMITDIALPAVIFYNLSSVKINPAALLSGLAMFCSMGTCFILAWCIGKFLLKLSKRQMGSFILVSGIGCSSTIGYALIMQMWPHNTDMMSMAISMNEVGTILPLFTLGIFIASYYGDDVDVTKASKALHGLKDLLRSPIFISFILVIIVSYLPIPRSGLFYNTFSTCLKTISFTLPFFVAISIGLMLTRIQITGHLFLIILPIAIMKLILDPAFAYLYSDILRESKNSLLILETAMPSGAIAAVIAMRYNCDEKLASMLVIATLIISVVTIPVVFQLL